MVGTPSSGPVRCTPRKFSCLKDRFWATALPRNCEAEALAVRQSCLEPEITGYTSSFGNRRRSLGWPPDSSPRTLEKSELF